jgi:hypothetical protein
MMSVSVSKKREALLCGQVSIHHGSIPGAFALHVLNHVVKTKYSPAHAKSQGGFLSVKLIKLVKAICVTYYGKMCQRLSKSLLSLKALGELEVFLLYLVRLGTDC